MLKFKVLEMSFPAFSTKKFRVHQYKENAIATAKEDTSFNFM